jgi:hypothetical protein
VTLGAGLSSAFVLGEAQTEIDEARLAVGVPGEEVTGGREQDFVEGAVAIIATPPGLAPWVGGRVGVGEDSDAGVTYSGRSVRVDGRHAFEDDNVALSLGLGVSGLLQRPGSDAPAQSGPSGEPVAPGGRTGQIPGLDAGNVTGFGADIPVIAGWRSDAELVSVWGGARGGYERMSGELLLRINLDPTVEQPADFEATRWYAGGLVGLAVGVEPIRVAVELDVTWSQASGAIDVPAGTSPPARRTASVQAVTVVPAAAVVGRF